jgi:hypothetical protein
MLIWTEAWSLAVMILLVAELQDKKKGNTQHTCTTDAMGHNFNKVEVKRTTSWGRRGPPSCPLRSAWWQLWELTQQQLHIT